MRTISILPEKEHSYRALAGDRESTGRTAGEALDNLNAQLADEEGAALVIVQNHKADEFFNATQQERLTELMRLRETGALEPEEGLELESLVEAELHAARQRAEAISATRRYYAEALRIAESLLSSTTPAPERSRKV